MKSVAMTLVLAVLVCGPACAQEELEGPPDLEITGTLRARRLDVEKAPDVQVRFHGTPERHTVWETWRVNLPEKLQDGATYTNVQLDFVIESTFKRFDVSADLRK